LNRFNYSSKVKINVMNKLKLTQEMNILSREIEREEAKYVKVLESDNTSEERKQIDMRIKQLQDQFQELSDALDEIQENEPSGGGE